MAFSAESAPQSVTMPSPGPPLRPYDGGAWTLTPDGTTLIITIESVLIHQNTHYANLCYYRATVKDQNGVVVATVNSERVYNDGVDHYDASTISILGLTLGETYSVTLAFDDGED